MSPLSLHNFCGVPLRVSSVLPVQPSPQRHLAFKRWHGRTCYAERVQKKWTRRYGMTERVDVIACADSLIVSADVYTALVQTARARPLEQLPDLHQPGVPCTPRAFDMLIEALAPCASTGTANVQPTPAQTFTLEQLRRQLQAFGVIEAPRARIWRPSFADELIEPYRETPPWWRSIHW